VPGPLTVELLTTTAPVAEKAVAKFAVVLTRFKIPVPAIVPDRRKPKQSPSANGSMRKTTGAGAPGLLSRSSSARNCVWARRGAATAYAQRIHK